MAEVTMTLEEYLDLIRDADTPLKAYLAEKKARPPYGKAKPKRRASAYSKRYGAAFKRLQKKYKTKSGAWRKGGFKACQKAAHKAAKKK